MKNLTIIFFGLLLSIGGMADRNECLKLLKNKYKSYNKTTVVWSALTTTVVLSPVSILFAKEDKGTANDFLRAKRIVFQAHFKKTDEKLAPELYKLVNNLKQRNDGIKLRMVKTVIKRMAAQMTGICSRERLVNPNVIHARIHKKNFTDFIYRKVVEAYNLPNSENTEDSEETEEEYSEY